MTEIEIEGIPREQQAPEAEDALAWALETKAQMVDLKFCDLLGRWQHMTMPITAFGDVGVRRGPRASTARRSAAGRASPRATCCSCRTRRSAILDPFTAAPTLSLVCEIADPITGEPYGRDPRRVARRAEEYLRETGIADTAYFGPECEFFVFDEVSFDLGAERGALRGRLGRGPLELRHARPRLHDRARRAATSRRPRTTRSTTCAREIVLTLERLGIPCEFHHHEVASAASARSTSATSRLTRMADQVMAYKYVVRNVARAAGKTATFMPKPLFGDNGSGMHTHQSLWKEGTPLMADRSGYAGLSQLAPRLRRRPPRARTGAARVLRADDELLPPARARLRGAGQPRLLAAEPLGGDPHPDVLGLAQGEAARVPLPGRRPRTRTWPSPRC